MKKILILDDNKYILEALSSSLCTYLKDCTIMTATSSTKAADILSSVPVDLILTDLDLPVAKGFAFIEHAKEQYPAVPVCVMTGDCAPSVITRLKAMGVRQYIQKPFQFDKLAGIIAQELGLEYPASQHSEPAQA